MSESSRRIVVSGRRQFLGRTFSCAAALCGGVAFGIPRVLRAENANAKRILILGDSMIAGAFGLFMERKLEAEHQCTLHRMGKSSTGLARPDFFDWIEVGPTIAGKFQPDAVVVMFGGNDAQAIRLGSDRKAGWIQWGKPEWEPEYRRRIRQFADLVAPVGTHLCWVGMPVMRPRKLNARVQALNTIFASEMQMRAQSDFIDIWPVLSNEKGEYTDRVKMKGRRRLARAPDGVHLTVKGAHHLVDAVTPEVARRIGLVDFAAVAATDAKTPESPATAPGQLPSAE